MPSGTPLRLDKVESWGEQGSPSSDACFGSSCACGESKNEGNASFFRTSSRLPIRDAGI